MKRTKWDENKISMLKENYGKIPIQDLALKLDAPLKAIRDKAWKLGLKYENRYRINYNRNFFSEINNQSSYWAGFIAADGYINIKNNFIQIHLKEQDVDHLELLKVAVEYKGTVKKIERFDIRFKTPKHTMCSIVFSACQQWIKDLEKNFNITSKKSTNISPPPIKSKKYIYAFIKGFIDGDGSICVKKSAKKYRLRLSIIGKMEILLYIKYHFEELVKREIANIHKDGTMYKLEVSGEKGNVILNFFNGLPTPALTRKWNKLLEFPPVI